MALRAAAHSCPPWGSCACRTNDELAEECADESPVMPNGPDSARDGITDEDTLNGTSSSAATFAMDALRALNDVLIHSNSHSHGGVNQKQMQKDLDLVVDCWRTIAHRSSGKENAQQDGAQRRATQAEATPCARCVRASM